MIKTKVFVYIAILILTLTGCGKEEPEQLTVYSFSGENEQLAVSNGVIVLNGTEEILPHFTQCVAVKGTLFFQ